MNNTKTIISSTEENTIKGYLILAAQNAELTKEQIKRLIEELSLVMEYCNKDEAEEIYLHW